MQNYNHIFKIDVTDEGLVEPVDIDTVKNYLRIDSIDESDATSIFNEDELLSDLITTSREELEEYCGVNLIDRSLKVTLTNLCGMIELPGPVYDVTKITAIDSYGNDITTQLKFVGTDFPLLVCPTDLEKMVFTYDVSFDSFPKSLKIELLRKIAYMWMNRGDDNAPEFKWMLSSKYMRKTWLA